MSDSTESKATTTTYLVIHSKDRDVSLYPNRGSFRINLREQCNLLLKDIVSISLYSAVLPTATDLLNEPYLLLQVDELSGAAFSASNDDSSNAFALIQMDRPIKEPGFINAKMDSCRHVWLQGNALGVGQIGSLTIKVLKQDGQPFNFGTDAVGNIDLTKQMTFVFEIKQLVKR